MSIQFIYKLCTVFLFTLLEYHDTRYIYCYTHRHVLLPISLCSYLTDFSHTLPCTSFPTQTFGTYKPSKHPDTDQIKQT